MNTSLEEILEHLAESEGSYKFQRTHHVHISLAEQLIREAYKAGVVSTTPVKKEMFPIEVLDEATHLTFNMMTDTYTLYKVYPRGNRLFWDTYQSRWYTSGTRVDHMTEMTDYYYDILLDIMEK